ncbi:type III pantothenate kinase [Candidatus Parabeggiatoa sp. HSG14]|uniref:type III pantothenate kinase n=1 Tax=Candidatus Parabeggiatoa sp. HSG14 TaxID=3055593 RepID=UPI0025A6B858|nr:type III pantothenate kinase [Thiotrichales bacterium HSG14]
MMLMVDMGNSSLKWAFFDKGKLSPLERIPYQSNNLKNLLTQAWLRCNIPPRSVWVSNVAGPQKAELLTQWITTHWGLKPIFIKTTHYECGVKNGYENPAQLGVDRWLALIGAHHLEKGMLCVIDCGTAVTLDILSASGHHQGGLIIPGITTMRDVLLDDTYALAHLNKILPQGNDKQFLAHDTRTGISQGALYAVIGLVKYVVNTLEKQGNKIKLILTGGSASAIKSFLQTHQHVPDLVLQGLVVIASQSL